MYKDAVVIVPVYNEAPVIDRVLAELSRKFKYIVCVDDGSQDGSTVEIAKHPVRLVSHPQNLGQGAAINSAVRGALELPVEYFITFDADGQHDVDDALSMLEKIRNSQVDVVLGSRFLGSSPKNMPHLRRMGLRMGTWLTQVTTGLELTDTHNGLRVFNRRVATRLEFKQLRAGHASEFLEIISHEKYTFIEYPVTIHYTEHSRRSRRSFRDDLGIAIGMIRRSLRR